MQRRDWLQIGSCSFIREKRLVGACRRSSDPEKGPSPFVRRNESFYRLTDQREPRELLGAQDGVNINTDCCAEYAGLCEHFLKLCNEFVLVPDRSAVASLRSIN